MLVMVRPEASVEGERLHARQFVPVRFKVNMDTRVNLNRLLRQVFDVQETDMANILILIKEVGGVAHIDGGGRV